MFKYFSKNDDLINVFTYIKSFNDIPKVIISDMNFLNNINNNSGIINNIISDPMTIDFFVIDTYNDVATMQDKLDNLINVLYSQDVTNSSFFVNNTIPIEKINNIIKINNPNSKNTFLYELINDKFYKNSFETPILFFILFSSIPSLIDFICKFDKFSNTCFVLKPNEIYDINKVLALRSFIEILLKKD